MEAQGYLTGWIDGLLLTLLIIGVFTGFRRGLIRGTIRLASYFVSLWLGWKWSPVLSQLLEIQLGLKEWMATRMKGFLAIPLLAGSAGPTDSVTMDNVNRILDDYGLPVWQKQLILSQVREQLGAAGTGGGVSGGALVMDSLISLVIHSIAFFIIIASVQFLAELIGKALQSTVGRLPLVWGLDRMGGAVLGFAQQFFLLSTAIGLIAPVLRFWPGAGEGLLKNSALAPPMVAFFNSVAAAILRMAGGV